MDKEDYQGMSNMAGMILVSSKNALGVMTGGGGEQGRGRRSERHVSSATTTMARREAPSGGYKKKLKGVLCCHIQ